MKFVPKWRSTQTHILWSYWKIIEILTQQVCYVGIATFLRTTVAFFVGATANNADWFYIENPEEISKCLRFLNSRLFFFFPHLCKTIMAVENVNSFNLTYTGQTLKQR